MQGQGINIRDRGENPRIQAITIQNKYCRCFHNVLEVAGCQVYYVCTLGKEGIVILWRARDRQTSGATAKLQMGKPESLEDGPL